MTLSLCFLKVCSLTPVCLWYIITSDWQAVITYLQPKRFIYSIKMLVQKQYHIKILKYLKRSYKPRFSCSTEIWVVYKGKSRVALPPVSGWATKFPGDQICEKVLQSFHESHKKISRISCRTFQVKEWYFLSPTSKDTILTCAQTSKETIFWEGINTQQLLSDFPVSIFFLVRHLVCFSIDSCGLLPNPRISQKYITAHKCCYCQP